MPADEVTRGTDVESSRVRTGPRHAAPKKPLFTRFHVPAGKAIALAAMPTAVLMGMGFTPTLAIADGNDATAPASNSLTADEYKACVAALEGAGKDASPTPTPSPTATDGADDGKGDADEPSPSASAEDGGKDAGTDTDADQDGSSSSDSGSDDKDAEGGKGSGPAPTPSASASAPASQSQGTQPSPSGSSSGSEAKGGLLDGLGDALGGLLGGGEQADGTEKADGAETPSPEATPSASPSGSAAGDTAEDAVDDVTGAVKDTTGKVTGTVKDTVEGVTGAASEAAEDTAEGAKDTAGKATEAAEEAEKAAEEAGDEATASPSPTPSASESADPDDCPVATDAESGVDNPVPLPDDPWYLGASSLLLKGASYKGIVEVKTANGTTKKVLKYVISDGTDIGDLHQTVKDEQAGKTYHVQAAQGSTSTIRDGDTVMYTESISGNLLGLIPITFDPENPPPLDLPLIYFTKVTVVQAGQFGGTLHIPGLHQYTTD